MTPETRIRLQDMLFFARAAQSLVDRQGEDAIRAEWGLQMGLIKAVEVVGEAAFQIQKDERPEIAGLPWRAIVGMRHHLVHGYAKIRLDAIFDVVRRDLPSLIVQLEQSLGEEPSA